MGHLDCLGAEQASRPLGWHCMLAPLIALVAILLIAGMYLLPTLVAARRNHHNALAIAVLNIAVGWTVLGWLVALVWAFTSRPANRS